MVAEKGHYADEEESSHKKQKQDVEFSMHVRKFFLKIEGGKIKIKS